MNYRKILISTLTVFLFISVMFSQDQRNVEPSISIRYDDILNGMTPTSSIGIILGIDEDKYTGFDTNTEGDEIRLIMGWKWSVMGLGTKDIDDDTTVSLYTFGATYSVLDNMFTTVEYVMIDHETSNDFIRLSVGVKF